MKKAKNQKRQYTEENAIEAKRDTGVAKSAVATAKDFAGDFWEQVLGIGNVEKAPKSRGDLAEGQELVLTKAQEAPRKEDIKNIEPGLDYRREILHVQEKAEIKENREITTKIQEILIELKQLMHSTQELKAEFREIAVEPRIVNPGKYHVSFFEWMLLIIKGARMKIEDSAAWLAVFKSKKAKKEYWAMFKKHGTTFGLSGERNVATQVG